MLHPVGLDSLNRRTADGDSLALVECGGVAERDGHGEHEPHGVGRHVHEHVVTGEEVGHAVGDRRRELADDLAVLVEEQDAGGRTAHGRPAHLLHALHAHLIDFRGGRLAQVGGREHVTDIERRHIHGHVLGDQSRVGRPVNGCSKRHTADGGCRTSGCAGLARQYEVFLPVERVVHSFVPKMRQAEHHIVALATCIGPVKGLAIGKQFDVVIVKLVALHLLCTLVVHRLIDVHHCLNLGYMAAGDVAHLAVVGISAVVKVDDAVLGRRGLGVIQLHDRVLGVVDGQQREVGLQAGEQGGLYHIAARPHTSQAGTLVALSNGIAVCVKSTHTHVAQGNEDVALSGHVNARKTDAGQRCACGHCIVEQFRPIKQRTAVDAYLRQRAHALESEATALIRQVGQVDEREARDSRR